MHNSLHLSSPIQVRRRLATTLFWVSFTFLFTFILFSHQAQAAFTRDYILPPINSSNYEIATGESLLLKISYSSQSNPPNNIPTVPLGQSQSMRIRVLAPPGVASASIRAESNNWQGPTPGTFPLMGSFDHDPGQLCEIATGNGSKCGNISGTFIYFDNLHPAGGGLNEAMYGSGSPAFTPLDTARYLYFVLYHPAGAREQFKFESLHFSMLITDVNAYNTWRAARPWAGGPTSNSLSGVDGDDIIIQPDPIVIEQEPVVNTPSPQIIEIPTPQGSIVIETPVSNNTTIEHRIFLESFLLVDGAATQTSAGSGIKIHMSGTLLESLGNANGTPITQNMELQEKAFANIKANIIPNPSHDNVDVFALVVWKDDGIHSNLFENALWAQKFRPQSFFDSSDLSWQPWQGPSIRGAKVTLDGIAAYQKQININNAVGYTLSMGDGELIPPDALGDTGRVLQFFIGYKAIEPAGNPFQTRSLHILSMPLELRFPDRVALVAKQLDIEVGQIWVASNPDNNNPISSCEVADPDLVELTIATYANGEMECLVKGIEQGETTLTAKANNGQTSNTKIIISSAP